MNLEQLGVQELNAREVKSTDGGWLVWWFRISLGNYSGSFDDGYRVVDENV